MKILKFSFMSLSMLLLSFSASAQIVTLKEIKEAIFSNPKTSFRNANGFLVNLSPEKIEEINKKLIEEKASYENVDNTDNRYRELIQRIKLQKILAVEAQLERMGIVGNSSLRLKYDRPHYGNKAKSYMATVKVLKKKSEDNHILLTIKPREHEKIEFIVRPEIISNEPLLVLRRFSILPLRDGPTESIGKVELTINPENNKIIVVNNVLWYIYELGTVTDVVISQDQKLSCNKIF